jgi:hypothetical protein|tara:strand:+ start:192 stop:302 length:111 start_codon:yes stop_codon:yes gene_type:complete
MITEEEVMEYAKYYYAVKSQLRQKPLNFQQWKQKNL